MDERQVWRTIRKELEEIGITVAAFDANKEFILQWFVNALENGAFEEQLRDDTLSGTQRDDSSDRLSDGNNNAISQLGRVLNDLYSFFRCESLVIG